MNRCKNLILLFLIALVFVSCQKRSIIEERNAIKVNLKSVHGPFYIEKMIRNDHVKFSSRNKSKIAAKRWHLAINGANRASRSIPILSKIRGEETALIVVDMQRCFLDSGAAIEVPEGRNIIANINKLALNVRAKNGIVIFTRYLVNEKVGLLKYFEKESYLDNNRESPLKALKPDHEQFELHPDLYILQGDIVMDKIRYSAVLGSNIVEILKTYKIKNVIITGVTTDVCAGGTAESLMQVDFNVIMVWDGCAALDRLEHELFLAKFFGLYGDVMPTEEVIMRLE